MSAMSRLPLPYASRHECEEKGGQETRARLRQTQACTAVMAVLAMFATVLC